MIGPISAMARSSLRRLAMQRTLVAAFSLTAVLLAVSVSSPASAQGAPAKQQKSTKSETLKQTGTIITLLPEEKMFICQWQTNQWPYKVTDKTVFRSKGKTVTFADLKLDSRVSMTFHMDGKQRVADLVTIEQ
jgi:DNA gyrase/topoisomerase IV subunit B